MKTRKELKDSITEIRILPMKEEDRFRYAGGEVYDWIMIVHSLNRIPDSKAVDETFSLDNLIEEAIDLLEINEEAE